jgi:CheY-like chemotaxis protein
MNTAGHQDRDLLAQINHELRTPLNGILGLSYLLLSTELSPEQRQYADMIHSSGQRLLTWLNDFFETPSAASMGQDALLSGDFIPLHILIAEDDPVNQMVAQATLRKLGHTSEVVPHGQAALRALQKNTYDVIFMDCQMPELDGYATTEAIRNHPGEWDPEQLIIALTANSLGGDRERSLAAGMNDHLVKPFTPAEMHGMLMRWAPQIRVKRGLAKQDVTQSPPRE